MCPVCLATAALVVAGTASTGGLTSLLAFKLTSAERSTNTPPEHRRRGEENRR
jgi:hypothetical protein